MGEYVLCKKEKKERERGEGEAGNQSRSCRGEKVSRRDASEFPAQLRFANLL